MKKTLFIFVLAVIAFAIPALAGDGGGSCTVISRLTPSATGTMRPRIEAVGNVEVYIGPDMVAIRATSDKPVSFRVVNLNNGETEEHPSNIFSIYTLPEKIAPDYMVIDADGEVTLYCMEAFM